jgi:zinc/manganese transport system permease protein
MKDTILFLLTPATGIVLLAGILGYFGTHILSRGIIFIDIAIAQIAALGTMIGLLLGLTEGSFLIQLISYVFTIMVIGSFAFIRTGGLFVPLEAIIGIVYCLGLAVVLLLAEFIPGGSNYVTKTITGNILWVTWDNVIKCALLFGGIGLVHILLGAQFRSLSDHGESTPGKGSREGLINLLFYITFGIVIVKSVMIGGIFLVFTLLVAPAAAAALISGVWKKRLVWSWIIGVTASLAGIIISYSLNISNGPAIVCLLGGLVFVLALLKIVIPGWKGSGLASNLSRQP